MLGLAVAAALLATLVGVRVAAQSGSSAPDKLAPVVVPTSSATSAAPSPSPSARDDDDDDDDDERYERITPTPRDVDDDDDDDRRGHDRDDD